MPGPVLGLGPELSHLNIGDIIYVSVDGSRVGAITNDACGGAVIGRVVWIYVDLA